MNSAQRRRARRGFPYVVVVRAQEYKRYFEHDNRVDQGRAWCRRQFEKGSWLYREGWDHAEFKFAREQDAVYFSLKWT